MEELIQTVPDLIKTAEGLYSQFVAFTKTNPVVGGMAGLWLLGVVTFFLRTTPLTVINLIKRYTTVTGTLSDNHESFHDLLKWLEKEGKAGKARTIRVSNGKYGHNKTAISIGLGTHYFFHKFRLFKMVRNIISADGGEKVKEGISITTIGFSQKALIKLIKDTEPSKKQMQRIYTWADKNWVFMQELEGRPIKSVILDKGQKERILDFIKEFRDEKSWYVNNGIPYKTGIILNGPPGTGKTSLVRAIGSHLDMHLCVLNCGSITGASLQSALSTTPKNSVVLLEDFDSIGAAKKRKDNESDGLAVLSSLGVTLSELLNAIDGVFSSNGRILIATTNHIEMLDPALIRPGRFDLPEKLDYCTDYMVEQMFLKFFPNYKLKDLKIREKISPAQIENCFLMHKKDPDVAKDMISKLQYVEVVKKLSQFASSSQGGPDDDKDEIDD